MSAIVSWSPSPALSLDRDYLQRILEGFAGVKVTLFYAAIVIVAPVANYTLHVPATNQLRGPTPKIWCSRLRSAVTGANRGWAGSRSTENLHRPATRSRPLPADWSGCGRYAFRSRGALRDREDAF